MAALTNYKCPACTAPLFFHAETGKLHCRHCESSFDVDEIKALYPEIAEADAAAIEDMRREESGKEAEEEIWDSSGLSEDWGKELDGMRLYTCPSCGAELITEETTAATFCPYCGNNAIIQSQFAGGLRPDYIIPFQITKKEALSILKKHYRSRFFTPKEFFNKRTVDKMEGVYVPFWLFDGEAIGTVEFHAENKVVVTENDEETTTIDHYNLIRSGSMLFEKVPVDASTKMRDEYMDSIEPYDYSALKSFSTAYLPGFMANIYDVSIEEAMARASSRCKHSFVDGLQEDTSIYSSVYATRKGIRFERGKVHYALLPVWLLNVHWKDEDYLFAINGQTGRIVGKTPAVRERAIGLFLKITVGLSAVGGLLAYLSVL